MTDEEDKAWKSHVAERRALMDHLDFPKDWEWVDADMIIHYACMKALDFYVYESGGIEALEESTEELKMQYADSLYLVSRQLEIQSEAAEIWRYWNSNRPRHEYPAVDDAMLERLMKIRKGLWV